MSRRDDVFKSFERYKEETADRVNAGIENNRKGLAVINVTDKGGNAVSGAKLKISQKKHEFLYGANLFMLDELETQEKNQKYREAFKNNFNLATLPFYWSDLEPEQGKPRFEKDSPKVYRRPAPDLCLEYCEENGITPKEHCLTYFNFTPDWVSKTDIIDMKRKLEKRYKECAERYSGRIRGWEVINELLCAQDPHNKNPFFRDDNVFEWNLRLADKYFTTNELIVNEASHVWEWACGGGTFAFNRSPYYQMVSQATAKGVRIDTVGIQFHVFKEPEEERKNHVCMYNPQVLFAVLDQYEKLGKPLQITEITIPAYSDSKEDEQIQADLIEQLYSIWFSHKSVEAIIYWNLVDGYAAFAPQGDMQSGENIYRGGLMRFDMSKKPAYERINSLFNEKWRTNTDANTDENGMAKFKGFYGDYEIEIDGKKYDISTSKNGVNEFNIIL